MQIQRRPYHLITHRLYLNFHLGENKRNNTRNIHQKNFLFWNNQTVDEACLVKLTGSVMVVKISIVIVCGCVDDISIIFVIKKIIITLVSHRHFVGLHREMWSVNASCINWISLVLALSNAVTGFLSLSFSDCVHYKYNSISITVQQMFSFIQWYCIPYLLLSVYSCVFCHPFSVNHCMMRHSLVTSRLSHLIQFKYIKMATLYTSLYLIDLHGEDSIKSHRYPNHSLQFFNLGNWHPRLLCFFPLIK